MSEPSLRRVLYTVDQMRRIDRAAMDALGISGSELMRRAASDALRSLRRHWPQARRVRVHCGPGNNGGDGFLLGVLAHEAGLQVDVVALEDTSRGDGASARAAWVDAGGPVHAVDALDGLPLPDVQVDALYGIGLNRAPAPAAAALLPRR